MSLIKHETAINHTTRQSEIPALLESWVKNTHSCEDVISTQKNASVNIFVKTKHAYILVGGVNGVFSDIFPSDQSMALGSTQPLVKMSKKSK